MSGDGRPQIALLPGLRAEFPPRVVALLTSGGLRGGIALALALPASPRALRLLSPRAR